MARDLTKGQGDSVRTNGDGSDAAGDSPGATGGLAGELVTDAYNIVAALACLSVAYWTAFRTLPAELFTLGLVATALVVVNVVVALGRWNA